MMTDPIADMLTRIRNASLVHKSEVAVPYSKLKLAVATILVREGYLAGVEAKKEMPSYLLIKLKYVGGQPAVQSLKRVSTPGHRHYIKKNQITDVLNGMGVMILSTPRGILTGGEAKAAAVGGEVLCEVY